MRGAPRRSRSTRSGVGEERPAEGDQVGPGGQHVVGGPGDGPGGEAGQHRVADQDAGPVGADPAVPPCAGVGVHEVQVGQVQAPQPGQQSRVEDFGVVLLDTVDRAPGREPYAHPVRADRVGHRLGDLRREPHPPLHRPAVAVRPAIGVPGEELVQQMPVGRVHLDALEARVDGPAGRGGEVGDGGPDVGRGHLTGHDGRPVPVRSEDRLRQRYGGGRDGCQARGRRMADPAAVLELQEHPPAGRPHGLGHPPPTGRVPVGVERGDVRIRLPDRVRCGGLADDQAGGGALGVVGDHEVGRGAVGLRAVAGERGHHQAMGKSEPAEPGRCQEVRCR